MYCKNCGKPVGDNQEVCLNCGVKVGMGNTHCANCGKEVNPNAAFCMGCGCALNLPTVQEDKETSAQQPKSSVNKNWIPEGKDKAVALVLCFFLGFLGIHNFYLGESKKGVFKIITAIACGISVLFAIIDLVKMLMDTYVVDEDAFI